MVEYGGSEKMMKKVIEEYFRLGLNKEWNITTNLFCKGLLHPLLLLF